MEKHSDKTVLITGITEGIGKALATEFASNGYNLIGIARHKEELEEVAKKVAEPFGVQMGYIVKDLTKDGAAKEIYEQVKEWGNPVDVLVNNAGMSQKGEFVEIPVEKHLALVHLNIVALTHLTRLFLEDMVQRNSGRILQLGSISGFQPGPLQAVYHASKAYVVSFSEALAIELEDKNSAVTVTCLCPGPTDTDTFEKADMQDSFLMQFKDTIMQKPEEVARGAYKALMSGERIYIPGTSNKVMTFLRRVMPRGVQSRIQKKFYESYEE